MEEMMLKEYLKEIDRKQEKLCGLSDRIWDCPETAFGEFKSEAALLEFFKSEGFEVKEKVYGVETAFTAEYGSGSPRIGILGEFDALSGGGSRGKTGGAARGLRSWMRPQSSGGRGSSGSFGCQKVSGRRSYGNRDLLRVSG